MAGQLTVDQLRASTGVLATQNGMTGIAKAWCYYNGSTQTINGSFNISSVTYNGVGNYTFNFTTAMPNANYSAIAITGAGQTGTAGGISLDLSGTRSTTQIQVQTFLGNSNVNYSQIQLAVLSA
jgi:osmotically-inducible protein OsmY